MSRKILVLRNSLATQSSFVLTYLTAGDYVRRAGPGGRDGFISASVELTLKFKLRLYEMSQPGLTVMYRASLIRGVSSSHVNTLNRADPVNRVKVTKIPQ